MGEYPPSERTTHGRSRGTGQIVSRDLGAADGSVGNDEGAVTGAITDKLSSTLNERNAKVNITDEDLQAGDTIGRDFC